MACAFFCGVLSVSLEPLIIPGASLDDVGIVPHAGLLEPAEWAAGQSSQHVFPDA